MKYVESKKKYAVIGICIILILVGIILEIWILHTEHVRREISLLGILYEEDGGVSQEVVNQFLREDVYKAYYASGEQVLKEKGYEKSGKILLGTIMPKIGIGIFIIMLCIIAFLMYYLYWVVKVNKQYQQTVLEWMEGTDEVTFPTFAETRPLLRKVEEMRQFSREKEALLQKEKEIVLRFMEDISHQLKTPLAVLRLYCEREINESPEMEDKMQDFLVQVDKMSLMIRNLLQTGRLESGRVQMKYTDVPLEEFKEILLYDLGEMAQKKGIRLDIGGCMEQTWYFDLNWMKEAVENIIKNGLEHGREGTVVKVRFSKEAHDYCIRISNIGRNIEEEKLKLLFERFVLSEEGKGGSGLGLSIAKLIVQSHFGTVEAKNCKGGVLFEIIFPVFQGSLPYEKK